MGCVGGVGRALSYDNDANKLHQWTTIIRSNTSAGHGVERPMEIALRMSWPPMSLYSWDIFLYDEERQNLIIDKYLSSIFFLGNDDRRPLNRGHWSTGPDVDVGTWKV